MFAPYSGVDAGLQAKGPDLIVPPEESLTRWHIIFSREFLDSWLAKSLAKV